jgi:Tol biopolymer transport system component
VAIKVLPEAVAQSPDRLARFDREARLLASLSHQNIATLYGLEEHDGVRFLAMELAEGETLADRIAKGPLPLDDALDVASQIAEAFEAAHNQGIIHRDLKPANVMVSPEGHVKILDFGLAKAWLSDLGDVDLTQSPTITTGTTASGALIGTFAYMSPEQARGRPVDKRTDVWAYGCTLYEMITGRRLFERDNASDVLADILRSDIDFGALPPTVPPSVRRLLARCLQRDPARRLRDLGDAILELDERDEARGHLPSSKRSFDGLIGWAAALVAAIVAAVLAWQLGTARGEREILTTELAPPEGTSFELYGDMGSPPVISPDGSMVAFGAAAPGEVVSLWVRSLQTGETRQVVGTAGGFAPFWSPDSRSIGYFDYGALKRVDLAGGSPLTLCAAAIARGGVWTEQDQIIFARDYNTGLHRIAATGGEVQQITTPIEGRHTSHRWPALTPDGSHVLYLAISHASPLSSENELRLVRVDGSDDRPLVRSPANGAVVDDRLLFMKDQALLVQQFDARQGALTGEPRIIAPQVYRDPDTWHGAFAAFDDLLLYQVSPSGAQTQLMLFDLEGRQVGTAGEPALYGMIDASPEGRTVAVSIGSPSDIWVVDLQTGMGTRLTFGPSSASSPVWSADGTEVFYRTYDADSPSRILAKKSSGAGDPRVVLDNRDLLLQPADVSPDGRFLILEDAFYTPGADIWVNDLSGDKPPRPLIERPGTQTQPAVSPDGRWLTYRSDESGRLRVYLEPFVPTPSEGDMERRSGRWEIPADPGGSVARWSPDNTALLHLTVDRRLVAIDIEAVGETIRIGSTRDVCQTNAASVLRAWDVVPGSNKVVLISQGARAQAPITAVIGLRRLLAEAGK